MSTKQLVFVIAVVAVLSAGLGVVVTSRMGPREVTRAFCISHEGNLVATPNADHPYSGEDRAPSFDAALSSEYPHDMRSLVPRAILGQTSNNGRPWSSIGY